jgi:hypothetical protein
MGYYPFEEGIAGTLRDNHKTSESSSYLLAANEIVQLARDVLAPEQYEEAELIAKQLTGNKKSRESARARLLEIVCPPPKRPIYYAQHEIQFLPRWTRDALRDLGDYVDMMVKSATYERQQDKRIFRVSFGPAINAFNEHWPEQGKLTNFLQRYNRFLYRPAKHDFKLPRGRVHHRFTSREVVLSAYVTMKLGEMLAHISKLANSVKQDKEDI